MKAVLFDLDGTLLDTLADIAACANRMRAEIGLKAHPKEAYRGFVGNGLKILITRAFPAGSTRGPKLAALSRRFSELYAAHCLDKTRPYPGIARLLDALARRGLPMAIVSNKPQRFTEQCVKALLRRWRFKTVRGERPGVPLKPNPAAPLEAARALGARAADILYVGDTGTDMKTAVAAGMLPVGALWGFRGAAELKRHGARVLIRRPCDLLGLLRTAGAGGLTAGKSRRRSARSAPRRSSRGAASR